MNPMVGFEAKIDRIERLFEVGNHAEILALTDQILAESPPPHVAVALHRRRARAYALQENWEQAALEWTKVLAQIPEDPEARSGAARRCDADNLPAGRRAAWERAVGAFNPSETVGNPSWALYNYCSCTEGQQGRPGNRGGGQTNLACQQAEALCTRAIGFDPENPFAYCTRAGVHHCRRNWAAALADCCRAIELDPRCVPAYSLRASIHNAQGELEEAIADWTRVLELNPSDAVTCTLRGFAYEELGEDDKATLDHVRAFELDRAKSS